MHSQGFTGLLEPALPEQLETSGPQTLVVRMIGDEFQEARQGVVPESRFGVDGRGFTATRLRELLRDRGGQLHPLDPAACMSVEPGRDGPRVLDTDFQLDTVV